MLGGAVVGSEGTPVAAGAAEDGGGGGDVDAWHVLAVANATSHSDTHKNPEAVAAPRIEREDRERRPERMAVIAACIDIGTGAERMVMNTPRAQVWTRRALITVDDPRA